MSKETLLRSVGTHDGQFHADEVTACALLVLFDKVDRKQIIRTRDQEVLDRCEYVCDVGGIFDPSIKRFDHHQSDYTGDRSSAGMIVDYMRDEGDLSPEEYKVLREALIAGVDDHDNGRSPILPGVQTFSHVVANFSPVVYGAGDEELNTAFDQAFDFVYGHLERLIQRYRYITSCKEEVAKAMEDDSTCLIFDRPLPWLENFFALGGEKHPAVFLIMPSGEHWKLRAIPPDYAHRMDVRYPLPENWAGLLDEDLRRESGIAGAIFCHKGRFISVWETKEDALAALDYTLTKRAEETQ